MSFTWAQAGADRAFDAAVALHGSDASVGTICQHMGSTMSPAPSTTQVKGRLYRRRGEEGRTPGEQQEWMKLEAERKDRRSSMTEEERAADTHPEASRTVEMHELLAEAAVKRKSAAEAKAEAEAKRKSAAEAKAKSKAEARAAKAERKSEAEAKATSAAEDKAKRKSEAEAKATSEAEAKAKRKTDRCDAEACRAGSTRAQHEAMEAVPSPQAALPGVTDAAGKAAKIEYVQSGGDMAAALRAGAVAAGVAAAAAAASKKRAEDVYDVVCTKSISTLRQLLSKEEEGSAAASQLAGEIAIALMRHVEVYPQPAEQVAYLAELLEIASENSAEWRAAWRWRWEQVVPPAWLTEKCGRQYTYLLRGDARTAAHEFLHRCSECTGEPFLPWLCATHREGKELAALFSAAAPSSRPSEGTNSFDTLDASQLKLLSRMVFHAVINGDGVQLSFAELKGHVDELVRAALSEACTQQKIKLTEELTTKVLQYNHSCLAQQALATVLRIEVSGGSSCSAVTCLSHANDVELYIHVMPPGLCPSGMLPVSCGTISSEYSGYAGRVGSARLVGQPRGLSSLSVFLQHNTQLLFRESRFSSSSASICMSKLPARVLAALLAAQHRATALVEETMEGEKEMEVGEEQEAGEAAAEGEAVGDGGGGQDWSGAGKLTAEQKNLLNRWLVFLSAPASLNHPHLRLGVPTVPELLEAGLAVRAEDGDVTIPIALGSRVSTQPGTMRKDHDAQKRAAWLHDAASQELRPPKEQGLASDTRAFSMRPLGAFEQTYGSMAAATRPVVVGSKRPRRDKPVAADAVVPSPESEI